MTGKSIPHQRSRCYALIAIGLFVITEAAFCIQSYLLRDQPIGYINFANAALTVFMRWMPPFVITYQIERKQLSTLGMVIPDGKFWLYGLSACVALILPGLFISTPNNLVLEFVEQVVYIGLLEEFFYRGYLMNRFCAWLGNMKGLFLSSMIFGLAHVISRIANHGLDYFDRALVDGFHAILGGLIFGLIVLRAKNIWPSSIAHISTNMYLESLLRLASG